MSGYSRAAYTRARASSLAAKNVPIGEPLGALYFLVNCIKMPVFYEHVKLPRPAPPLSRRVVAYSPGSFSLSLSLSFHTRSPLDICASCITPALSFSLSLSLFIQARDIESRFYDPVMRVLSYYRAPERCKLLFANL